MRRPRKARKAARQPHELNPQDDAEIAALLDFTPVPRKTSQVGGWTPELQREFIARLAVTGSITSTCARMGKDRSGVTKLYNSPEGASFRESWHAAIDLAKRRREEAAAKGPPVIGPPPTIDRRRKCPSSGQGGPQPGQVLNEYGEWEDEQSLRRRGEDASERIRDRLLRIRRLYLQEISDSPGKRAAFEILTELPIDWDKAASGEAQPDEPYNTANQRQPDMILTAENGWTFGEIGYGPDRKAEMRAAMNAHLVVEGQEPIDWEAER